MFGNLQPLPSRRKKMTCHDGCNPWTPFSLSSSSASSFSPRRIAVIHGFIQLLISVMGLCFDWLFCKSMKEQICRKQISSAVCLWGNRLKNVKKNNRFSAIKFKWFSEGGRDSLLLRDYLCFSQKGGGDYPTSRPEDGGENVLMSLPCFHPFRGNGLLLYWRHGSSPLRALRSSSSLPHTFVHLQRRTEASMIHRRTLWTRLTAGLCHDYPKQSTSADSSMAITLKDLHWHREGSQEGLSDMTGQTAPPAGHLW